ncbi:BON domain-containing protein [Stratiformator vulcanicus]|nr:BON domain-containing protein [Stratiformator vulcanicus]
MSHFNRLTVGLVFLLCASVACGQSSSLFGSSGPIGQRNAALSGTGTAGGAGAFGTGSAVGQTGTGGAAAAPTVGNVTGFSGGFVGRSDNVGRFVGEQQAGTQQVGRAGGSGGRDLSALGNRGNQRGAGVDRNSGPASGANRSIPLPRPVQRIGFDYPKRTQADVIASADVTIRRFEDSLGEAASIEIAAEAEGRIVLRGTVSSERERLLAETLLRMEPGVGRVVNELRVDP